MKEREPAVKRLMCLLILLLLAVGSAAADDLLLPWLDHWDSDTPVVCELSLQAEKVLPYDDHRLEQLNALLQHIGLRIGLEQTSPEEWLTVLVDHEPAVTLTGADSLTGSPYDFLMEASLPMDDVQAWKLACEAVSLLLSGAEPAGEQQVLATVREDHTIVTLEGMWKTDRGETAVALEWLLVRDEDQRSDRLTLTTSRNQEKKTLERHILLTEDQWQATLTGDSLLTVDLSGAVEGNRLHITGTVDVNEKDGSHWHFVPDADLYVLEDAAWGSGTIAASQMAAGAEQLRLNIHVTLGPGTALNETNQRTKTYALDDALVPGKTADAVYAAIIRRLVLTEDPEFLSDGLPEESWRQITDAARAALEQEAEP